MMSDFIEIGSNCPDFSLENQSGETVSLDTYKGKWVVVYFYPKDNTPGCTVEAKEFSELKSEFEKNSAVILGVSPDTVQKHCNFIEKQGLMIDLLADTEKKMLVAYNAWRLKKLYGRESMGVVRSTYIIAPDGKLAYLWKKVKAAGHAQFVLNKLIELQAK
jgi:thioredoxin-dependent peroxiredoxin